VDLGRVSSSQHPWDNCFVVCRWGGDSHRLQTFVFTVAKNRRIHVASGNGRGVERVGGGDSNDGGAREGELD
jgi:hypothetical protein